MKIEDTASSDFGDATLRYDSGPDKFEIEIQQGGHDYRSLVGGISPSMKVECSTDQLIKFRDIIDNLLDMRQKLKDAG